MSRAIVILVLLAACGKQLAKDLVEKKETRLNNTQHFDIPTPISFSKITQSSSQDDRGIIHDFMHYNGTLTVGQAISFYKQEMDRSGWDIVDLSGSREGFLYCTKPHKQCGIQIRANVPPIKQMPTTVCLFVTSMA